MKRSGRGRGDRERVEAARRQAALALGRNFEQPFVQPTTSSSSARPGLEEAALSRKEAVYVLTIGEAAARLGISRAEPEALIDRGSVCALPTGFTRMIPTSEVERAQHAPGNGS